MSLGVSILLSSRGRPKRFSTCVTSAKRKATGPVEVVAYLDEDDPDVSKYDLTGIPHVIGPSINVGKRCRQMAALAKYDFFYLCGDDAVFVTQGWDVKLAEKIHQDGIGIVFGRDGWKDSPGHCMFTRRMSSLVDVFPEEFMHFGLDTYLADLSQGVKRFQRVEDVLIEHHHHRNGKAEQDATYLKNRDGGPREIDPKTLAVLRKKRLPRSIEILKEEIERFSSAGRAGDATGAPPRDEQTRSL